MPGFFGFGSASIIVSICGQYFAGHGLREIGQAPGARGSVARRRCSAKYATQYESRRWMGWKAEGAEGIPRRPASRNGFRDERRALIFNVAAILGTYRLTVTEGTFADTDLRFGRTTPAPALEVIVTGP